MKTAARRFRTLLAALFARPGGMTTLPESRKQQLAVEAMLVARSCCG